MGEETRPTRIRGMSRILASCCLNGINGAAMPKKRGSSPRANELALIETVAKIAGVSVEVLQVWEQVYGWPIPEFDAKGRPRYSPAMIEAVTWVVGQLKKGRTMDDIMRRPASKAHRAEARLRTQLQKVVTAFQHVPIPSTEGGQEMRRGLEYALATYNMPVAASLHALSKCFAPVERERACAALLREALADPQWIGRARFEWYRRGFG
jgi:hypothetical protein